MSYILDALKKAEHQSQTGSTHNLPTTTPPGRQWHWASFCLLGIAILALVAVSFWLGGLRQQNNLAQANLATGSLVEQPAAFRKPVVRSLKREAAVVTQSAAAPARTSQTVTPSKATSTAKPRAIQLSNVTPGETMQPNTVTRATTATQPSASVLKQAGSEYQINLHVYSESSDKRFAFVNKQKHREGDRIAPGVWLESITPNSVIINQNGQRLEILKNQ